MRRAIAAAALLALTACSPDSGTVVAKGYSPPWTQVVMSGKVIVPIVHPACYRIVLRDGDRDGSRCIDRAEWELIEVGDEWRAES